MSYTEENPRSTNDFNSDDDSFEFRRQKFNRERESPGRFSGRELDRFGRDKRDRSPTEPEYNRSRSRSPHSRSNRYSERNTPSHSSSSYTNRNKRGMYSDSNPRYNTQRDYNSRDGDSYRGSRRRDNRNYGDNKNYKEKLADPTSFDLVVSFKYYCEWKKSLKDEEPLEQDELHAKYEEYRRLALRKLFEMFFAVHKDEDWFIEKYKTEFKLEREKNRTEFKKSLYSKFIEKLESGKLDDICLNNPSESSKYDTDTEMKDKKCENEDAMEEEDQAAEESCTLFIRTVPPSVSRSTLEEEFKKIEGFEYLSFSEPNANKNFHRFGWIKFKSGTDMNDALEKLKEFKVDEFQFHFTIHSSSFSSQNRFTPEAASTPSRIKNDLINIQKAVAEFDSRTNDPLFAGAEYIKKKIDELSIKIKADYEAKNNDDKVSAINNESVLEESLVDDSSKDIEAIENPPSDSEAIKNDERVDDALETADKKIEDSSKSNELVTDKNDSEKEELSELELLIATKELDISIEYLRNVHFYCYYCASVSDNIEDFSRKCPKLHLRRVPRNNSTSYNSGNNWMKSSDTKNKAIIDKPTIYDINKQGGKLYEDSSIEHFKELIRPKDKGRFRCMVCEKLFKGDTFIRRHIINKHMSLVDNALISEIDFFNNFVLDAPNYLSLGAGQITNNANNHNFNQMSGNPNYTYNGNYQAYNKIGANQFQQNQGVFPGMMYPYQMMVGGSPGNRSNGPMMMPVAPYVNNFNMSPNHMGGAMHGHNQNFHGGQMPYMNPQMMGWPRPMVHNPMHGNLNLNQNSMSNNIGHNGLVNPMISGGPAPQPQMPPVQDPRSVRSYVDLDAPGDAEPDYGF
ncbi:Serrate RNA effector molecule-like protein [Smittium culicis]|uniref:Serrate RNA effector molecule-like protein n=1 Tax=Smittium culicis TaxID=133412 RepID=A0A1R1Y7V4_9FUNG|nr:Serrate RNA effector molecule-like protein [Smittium culicis]